MFVFFNDPATTEIYTLSLPDALPSSRSGGSVLVGASGGVQGEAGVDRLVGPGGADPGVRGVVDDPPGALVPGAGHDRSEEHTSEPQSRPYFVCRLLLEKKKKQDEYRY